MDNSDIFFFDSFPLVLQCGFDLAALCENEHAGSPLVETVDGKDYFSGFEAAFADVVVEDVLDGAGFVGLCFDGQ